MIFNKENVDDRREKGIKDNVENEHKFNANTVNDRHALFKKDRVDVRIFHANQTTKCLRNQGRTKGEGWSTAN